VLERCLDLYLTKKAAGPDRGRKLRAKYLERNGSVVFQVARKIHHRHSATTEFALDRVPVGKWFLDAVQQVGHGDTPSREIPYNRIRTRRPLGWHP
jgi:hypothetical protein